MIRVFSPSLAGNALLGITLGGVLAAVVGAVVTGILMGVVHAIIPQALHSGTITNQDFADLLLGPFVPLHSPVRDSLQLFLVSHGAAISVQLSAFAGSASGSLSIFAGKPLNALLLIPALFLTLGGYVAASTDLQNNPRSSLWRGVAIAVPYTVILFLMAAQVNGSIPIDDYATNLNLGTGIAATLNMDGVSLVIFGLLWGSLFGLLGASLKLARGQWKHMVYGYLQSIPVKRFAGMFLGALASVGLGFSLSLLLLFCAVGYLSSLLYSTQSSVNLVQGSPLFIGTVVQGPLVAMNLFFGSLGAPISYGITCTGGYIGCNYPNSNTHYSLSMFGGNPALPAPYHPWIYLLLAIPAISLFMGGRVSAAFNRSRGVSAGAGQGALIAIPFTILMMLLTIISAVSFSYTAAANGVAGSSISASLTASAGVGAFDLFLWALLIGAVFGALGGAYEASSLKMGVGAFLSALATPFRLISKPWCSLLDRLTRRPAGLPRTSARGLLYGALLLTVLLLIISGVVGGFLIAENQTLTFQSFQHITGVVFIALIALPGLFLISACASALTHYSTAGQLVAPLRVF